MGANLCTFRRSGLAHLPGNDDTEEDASTNARSSLLVGCLMPKCLKVEEEEEEEEMDLREKDIEKEKKPTLQEWLISSPDLDKGCLDVSGVQQLLRQSPKVCPVRSVCSYERIYSTPRESVSIGGAHEEVMVSSLSRSQSKKRVSFRLPEEADIHIIYSYDDADEWEWEI